MAEFPTDANIIERSRTDPAGFAEVFDRHYDPICGYLARRLPIPLAEDLAAETFLVAFRQRFDYDLSYSSARPWLYGIATNLLGRHRREEQRRIAAYHRSPPAVSDDGTDEIAARADARAQRKALARAIGELELGDRDAFLLQVLAGLSYPEIALALGVPAGTVKSRLHRTRQKLAAALAPEGVSTNG